MKRFAEEDLKNWFQSKKRMPLILRGARQVGKSTLVRLFCENNKLDLIEFNLERTQLRSISSEREEVSLDEILDEVQLLSKKNIGKKSLIFFDEIQEQPRLLKLLRYFYEEHPEIAVIAAGSLLEIALNSEEFSFPVGRVELYHLGPMTFTEYLWAIGEQKLSEKIAALQFTPAVVAKAKKELRNYYYVGGMPLAVKTYQEEKSLIGVRKIQEQILQTFQADFPKYNRRIRVDRIQRIFSACVLQLGKKTIFQKLDTQSSSRDNRRVVDLLIDSRLLIPCIHSDANSVPLAGEADPEISKHYFLDVGLVNCLLQLDLDVIDEEMKSNFNNKGSVAEQFVAQHLAQVRGPSLAPELYYWLRDKGSQKSEIDFLLQKESSIYPVEVKATTAGHMKSLFYFAQNKKSKMAFKVSLDEYSKKQVTHMIDGKSVDFELINLPHYAIEYILKAIEK